MLTAQGIIDKLGLVPHPAEGGFYRETYRSKDQISGELFSQKYRSSRALSTVIYYFLTPGTRSRIHRLKADEIFHFYLGGPITMLLLYRDGSSKEIILGPDLGNGQQVQVIIPAGVWQGSMLRPGGSYALLGTTVTPGFDYADYEEGKRQELLEKYPERQELIRVLTEE